MKLSTRSTYGMRALVELALASGHGPISAALIAKRQELSVAYLEQLLHRLKKQGLVRSVRGPRGGYVLAKEPEQIRLAEVVRVLDGANGDWSRQGRDGHRRTHANGNGGSRRLRAEIAQARQHAQRIARVVWLSVHERLTQSLDAVTIQDLCDEIRSESGEPLEHRYVFHI